MKRLISSVFQAFAVAAVLFASQPAMADIESAYRQWTYRYRGGFMEADVTYLSPDLLIIP